MGFLQKNAKEVRYAKGGNGGPVQTTWKLSLPDYAAKGDDSPQVEALVNVAGKLGLDIGFSEEKAQTGIHMTEVRFRFPKVNKVAGKATLYHTGTLQVTGSGYAEFAEAVQAIEGVTLVKTNA